MKRPITGAVLLTALSASLLCAQTTSATDTPPTPPEIAARTVARLTTVANKLTDIKTAATTIGTLTTHQVTADATADAAFYAILTSDQQRKYTTLRLDDMGGPGPGPGGPGH